jgi:hypothetical protein
MTKTWIILAAGAALAIAPAVQAQGNKDMNAAFAAGGKNFTVAVPEGYCQPEGADKALADAMAELDTLNLTHVTLRDCNNPDGDYSLVKSERNAQQLGVPKAMFIALAAKQLESELSQQAIAQGMDKAGQDIASGTGDTMTLSQGAAQAAGFDADCAYITGSAVLGVGGQNITTYFATCLTLAGGRVFAVHSYTTDLASVSYDMLKGRSRTVGASIVAAP